MGYSGHGHADGERTWGQVMADVIGGNVGREPVARISTGPPIPGQHGQAVVSSPLVGTYYRIKDVFY